LFIVWLKSGVGEWNDVVGYGWDDKISFFYHITKH